MEYLEVANEAVWEKIQNYAEKGIDIYANTAKPEERTFFRKITFRDSEMQNIVEDALEILGESVLTDNIQEVNNIAKDIKKLRDEITKLNKKVLSVPDKSIIPFTDTKTSISKEIAESNEKIEEYNKKIGELQDIAIKNMQQSGINISKDMIYYLGVAPNGSTIAQIMSIAINLKKLINYVETQFRNINTDQVQVAHTYVGLYFLGCRTQIEVYNFALKDIDEVYSVRLEKIYAEATALLTETNNLLSSAPKEQQAVYRTNISTMNIALTIMDEYRNYLTKQKKHIAKELKNAEEQLKVAVNTYKTVKISSQVIGLIKNSISDLDSIFNFQLPELNLMYGDAYKHEFMNLMERLKTSE